MNVAVAAETLAQALLDGGIQGVHVIQREEAQSPEPQVQNLAGMSKAMIGAIEREATENDVNAGYGPSYMPLPGLLLDINRLDMSSLSFLPNEMPNRRSWARLRPNNASLIVEWRSYNQIQVTGALKVALLRRIEALVRMLQQRPTMQKFHSLECLGYFEDNSSASEISTDAR
jgi:hypothetical protein